MKQITFSHFRQKMNKVGAGFGKLKLAVFGNCAPQLLCGTSRGDARELDVPPETFDSGHDQPEAQPPVPGSEQNRLGPDDIPSHSLFHCRVIGQESSFKKNTWKTMLAWGMAVVVLSGAGACRRKAGVEGRFEYTAGWISAELTRAMPLEKAPAEASEVVPVEDAGTGEKQLVRMEIPKKLGGRRVRSVAPKAFRQCTDAVSVKVPSKVSRIGAEAFAGCTELVWAELPSHLERLEDGLFSNCRRMVESVIPKRVGKIGARAYSGCVQLRRVAVPEGVRSVGEQAFSGCASLGSLDLPPGVTVLGQYAFRGCRSLEAFVLPPRLKKLEEGLFADCSALEKVEIPAGVAELGPRAFKGCASLASVVLPEKLVSIGDGVFADCRSLARLSIFDPGFNFFREGHCGVS